MRSTSVASHLSQTSLSKSAQRNSSVRSPSSLQQQQPPLLHNPSPSGLLYGGTHPTAAAASSNSLTSDILAPPVPLITDSDESDDEYCVLPSGEVKLLRRSKANAHRIAEAEAQKGRFQPSVIRVTNNIPRIDRAENHERSIAALEAVRAEHALQSGGNQRFFVDPHTGIMLLQDSVDTRKYQRTANASPSSGSGPHADTAAIRPDDGFHYKASMEALERLRDLRLMRKLGL